MAYKKANYDNIKYALFKGETEREQYKTKQKQKQQQYIHDILITNGCPANYEAIICIYMQLNVII